MFKNVVKYVVDQTGGIKHSVNKSRSINNSQTQRNRKTFEILLFHTLAVC
jgi:hypothetical protein